jgi:UDPglucose 6-dehydrogenase
MPATQQALGDKIVLAEDAYSLLDGSDALVILTDWQEFRSPDFAGIAERLSRPVIFDGRNLYDPKYVAKQGIEYYCIGRPENK